MALTIRQITRRLPAWASMPMSSSNSVDVRWLACRGDENLF
jgi:hypothetical protein